MTTTASPSSVGPRSEPLTAPCSTKELIGTIVCRMIIPLWLIAGAVFKLAERNPNLLPVPVKGAISSMHGMLGVGTLQEFMSVSMRSIIAVEFILAAAMIFLPRVSRWLALATLGLFIVILGWLIYTGQDKCGCFGTAGPSPRTMIVIDGLMFVAAAIFGPARRWGSSVAFVVTSVIGAAIAFGLPEKNISIDLGDLTDSTTGPASEKRAPAPADSGAAPEGSATTPAPAPTVSAEPPLAPPPPPPPIAVAPAAVEWPPIPDRPKGFYMPDFKKWPGLRLSEQPTMHMLRRPLPQGIDNGKWHIIFYRIDCDHCQQLIDSKFSGKLATKTLLVAVPDASPGAELPLKATDVVRTQLLRGANGPDYVIGTPVVVTVVDGVVKAVCEDPDKDPTALRQTLDAQ